MQIASGWPPTGIPATVLMPLHSALITGTAYTNTTGYPIVNQDIVDIKISVIKRCSLYTDKYKSWIAHATATPRIVKTLDTFETFWADMITFANQIDPRKLARLQDGHSEQRGHSGVVWQVNRKLWGRIHRHSRVGQDPRHSDCIDADPTAGDAPVLHGPTSTAPPHHLRATAASMRWLWTWASYPVDRQQGR